MRRDDICRGPVLRLAGLALLLSAAAAAWLLVVRVTPDQSDGFDYLLALVTVLGASLGSALLVLGAHVFDQVAISRPWIR